MRLNNTSGMNSRARKLTDKDVRKIRKRAAAGEAPVEIAKDYPKMNPNHIGAIIRRVVWRDV